MALLGWAAVTFLHVAAEDAAHHQALELNRDVSDSRVPHKSGCVLSSRIMAELTPVPWAVWDALLHTAAQGVLLL